MPVSSVTEHWIKQDAITINLNHFGDPDYLQVSVLAGAVVMAFKQDVIGYNAAHNYRTWPLQAANTYLELTSAYNVYARLTRSEVNASALIVYDPILRDIEGRPISHSEKGEEVLGEADPTYFYVFLGQISESLDDNGNKKDREWLKIIQYGSLDSSEQKNNFGSLWENLFKPHYDDPDDPEKLSWIEAKANMGVQGGVTMFVKGDNVNIPTIAEGLPFDGKTIWYNPSTKQIEVIGGTGGGTADAVAWNNIIGKPTWIGSTKPTYNYSEIQGTPDLSKYALASDIPSLSGYATQSWVESKGYALNSELTALSTKVNDFLEGSDTDTIINKWLELEAFLSGLSESDNLATILGTKADKTYVDGNFVTLTTQQTISGEKNFTGGLKVNGSPIVYDATNKYWKLEGDLLVTGGVTMYSSDTEFTPSTIMDAIVVDNVTIVKQDGKLVAVGGGSSGGGVADSVAWGNVLGKPSWITDTIPYVNIAGTKVSLGGSITQAGLRTALGLGSNAYSSTAYLPLSGGAITASGVPLTINRTRYTVSAIHFQANSVNVGRIGVGEDNNPKFMKAADGTWHNLWHAGNDGAGSGLDADLLDGKHEWQFYREARGIIASADIDTYTTRRSGSYGVNYTEYYGALFVLGNANNGSTSALEIFAPSYQITISPKIRYSVDNDRYTAWRILAFEDSNVASATKLQTARTIWGQSFDGTGNVSGDFVAHYVKIYDGNVIEATSNKKLHLNYYATSDMSLCYGGGKVGIGTTNPSYTLHVHGGDIATNQYIRVIARTGYGSGSCDMWYDGTNTRLDISSGLKVAYNILAGGGITMYSDQRKKTILNHVELSLKEIAEAPLIEHYYNSDEKKTTHVGSIAQYWAGLNDWFCKLDNEGYYTMEIQNAALASAISVARELVKFETETDRRIRLLEEENEQLKKEIEILKWNIA